MHAAGFGADGVLHRRQHQLCSCVCFAGHTRSPGSRRHGSRCPFYILHTSIDQGSVCYDSSLAMQPLAFSRKQHASGSTFTDALVLHADNVAMACYLAIISFCPAENVPLMPATAVSMEVGIALPHHFLEKQFHTSPCQVSGHAPCMRHHCCSS